MLTEEKPYLRIVVLDCIGMRRIVKNQFLTTRRIICGFMLELHSFEMEMETDQKKREKKYIMVAIVAHRTIARTY